ncbi:MAG TPA: SCO1664 family protein [Acidimicrobiales bacterium]|nr:SCO1664 family protein [Acidimicrobiales bacterium]HVC25590.1 SCO1664 family protein [Acidimicrobiales bacterium]
MSTAAERGAGRRALLEAGDVEVEGRMPWSSNVTLLVTVRLGTDSTRAIYKPAAGEEPLWDFPGGLFRREVAAYELSVAMGLDVVPETVLRAEAPFGEGSLQAFVDADFSEHYFSLLEQPRHAAGLRLVAGFDLVANNADRKGGHVLVDGDGHVWGIDNGLCFHRAPKLRTVMWDFAGEPLPDAVVAGCRELARAVPARLEALLEPDELDGLAGRARALLGEPRFPEPDPAGRPYPWPLV